VASGKAVAVAAVTVDTLTADWAASRLDQDRRRRRRGSRLARDGTDACRPSDACRRAQVQRRAVRRQARAFLRAIESSGFVLRYIDVNSEVTDVPPSVCWASRSATTGCSTSPAARRPRRAFERRDPSLEPLDPLEPLARADLDHQRGLDSADRCVVCRARSSEVCDTRRCRARPSATGLRRRARIARRRPPRRRTQSAARRGTACLRLRRGERRDVDGEPEHAG
jgi:hypothetical protein